jgi:small-conductance mechanosensitive channel
MIFLLFALSLSHYAVADAMEDMEKMSDQLKRVDRAIRAGDFEGEDLANWTKLTIKMAGDASLCVANNEAALLELKTAMDGLGEKVKDEDAEVTIKRASYEKQKENLEKVLAKCNLYITNSNEVSSKIRDAGESYFKQKYLVRSPNIYELIIIYLKNPFEIVNESGEFLFENSGIIDLDFKSLIFSIFAVAVAVLISIWGRKKMLLLESRRQWQDDFSENLIRASLTTLAEMLPYLSGAAVASFSALIITTRVETIPFITEFFVGLFVFYLATTVIRLLFSPCPPAKLFIAFTPEIAVNLAKRLRVLAVLGFIGFIAFYTVFSQSIIESNLLLARNIFSLFVVVNLVWTLQAIIKSPKLPRLRYVSMLAIAAIVVTLIAEWLGYRNLAFGSRRMILLTFVTFVIFIGASKLFKDLFDAIDEGQYNWCKRLHKTLGVDDHSKVPGLIWIRLLTAIVTWGLFVVLFISAWDYSGGLIEQVKSYMVNGFDIGEFRIVPSRILTALLVFGLIIILSNWVRSHLENDWLKMTAMGPGARDAMVTLIGYVMFLIALLVGMSVAGFDFSNIAIIAGALSVGIGFGLQNIVNNFVSGLIILFERPIRKGDWIIVGATEGHVKEIKIRSTRIETFDRSDVIVPNSEIISNQVTNWILSSQTGRASIPVGVAYGTDVEKVRDILLAIAEKNTSVVKSGLVPQPTVLFRAFGDSSLNFELRVFLYDIEDRLKVISEINFAIDKAFREQGIEIPFPQRDLHVKSMPEYFIKDEGGG